MNRLSCRSGTQVDIIKSHGAGELKFQTDVICDCSANLGTMEDCSFDPNSS